MSKKSLVIILILSVVVTYITAAVEVLFSGLVVAGRSGVPFRFGSSSLFGGSSIDYPMLLLDIAFWFVILWLIWKAISYFFGHGGR